MSVDEIKRGAFTISAPDQDGNVEIEFDNTTDWGGGSGSVYIGKDELLALLNVVREKESDR